MVGYDSIWFCLGPYITWRCIAYTLQVKTLSCGFQPGRPWGSSPNTPQTLDNSWGAYPPHDWHWWDGAKAWQRQNLVLVFLYGIQRKNGTGILENPSGLLCGYKLWCTEFFVYVCWALFAKLLIGKQQQHHSYRRATVGSTWSLLLERIGSPSNALSCFFHWDDHLDKP